MIGRDEAKEMLHRVVAQCPADEVQAVLYGDRYDLTRFAAGAITQNTSRSIRRVQVQARLGLKVGDASTCDLTSKGLERAAKLAHALASVAPEDDGLPALPGPVSYTDLEVYDEATAAFPPEARAEAVARAVKICADAGCEASGIFSTADGYFDNFGHNERVALLNSKGLYAYGRGTDAVFGVNAACGEGSGWAVATSPRAADIDAEAVAREAAETALRSRAPETLAPGSYPVVLTATAFSQLVLFFAHSFTATSIAEKSSFVAEKMGEALWGKDIHLVDDVAHPLQYGVPFDDLGHPRQRVELITDGVLAGVVVGARAAKRLGRALTGHSCGTGEAPQNVVFEGGTATFDELVAGIDRGVLVSRLHYLTLVDPYAVKAAGSTQDGTFLIEKGKVSRALVPMRFNEGVVDLLGRIEAMTLAERCWDMFTYPTIKVVAPAVRLSSFRFTD